MMQNGPRNVNNVAEERFKNLKKKMKLDFLDKEVANGRVPSFIDREKLERIFNEEPNPDHTITTTYELNEKTEFVDDTFEFIEKLELPPQLSLAIGLIISGYKTDNKQDFAKAVAALGEYLNA